MSKTLINCYKSGTITKYYKSNDFKEEKKEFLLFPSPGQSVKDVALDFQAIRYDQEIIVQGFLQKKITKKIRIENIAFSNLFFNDYFKSSKCTKVFTFVITLTN